MIVTIIITTPKMGIGRFRVIGAGSVYPEPEVSILEGQNVFLGHNGLEGQDGR